jgi:hypothetical protein
MKKRFAWKETRLFVALALVVQSISFFIMFIILCAKKKSIAAAFLAVSAMGGSTAGYLLWQLKEETDAEFDAAKEALENDEYIEFDETRIAADLAHGTVDEEEDADVIPCEETVSEEEFN